jgi:tetratricopeptide (TPR) repeat protein
LHERFASWLDERAADLVERDEILGHHLEQAARYKAELGHPDSALAERAGELLAAAGRRALWRGDARAAASLLERALELTRPVRFDAYLEIDRAQSYFKHDPERAAALADSVAERAQDAGDEAGAAVARVVAAHNRMEWVADPPIDELTAMIARALPLLEATDDHAGLVHVWFAQGFGVANTRGQFDEWATAAQKAIHHARLAGQQRTDLLNIEGALIFGPRPADEGVRILDGLVADAHHPQLVMARAVLLAMLGQFDESWPAARVARERLLELGDNGGDLAFATIASYAGDHRLSAEWLRRFCDSLEQHGQRGILSTFAPALGRELCELGRFDEAEQLANLGRELGAAEDFSSQALWRQVQARVHSHRAEQPEGERLAREAVAITERMDGLNFQGDAYCDLAEVLAAAGRTDEAAQALEEALERYERKKNLAMVAQVKPKLEELRARVS